jgi:hypothetical protein
MTRKYWLSLTPSLLVAAGIVLATLVAALAAKSGWLVLAAPLVLALAVIAADALASRLAGESSTPSPTPLILGIAFLVSSALVAQRDPSFVKALIPIAGWAAIFLRRPQGSRTACAGI